MANLNIKHLYPSTNTHEVCGSITKVLGNILHLHNVNETSIIKKALNLIINNNYFTFNNILYK